MAFQTGEKVDPAEALAARAEGRQAGPDTGNVQQPPVKRSWSARWVSLPDLGLACLRIFAGLSLALAHGFGKLPPSERFVAGVAEMGFPAPILFAWAAGFAESLGGLLLVVGLFTRPAAFFIITTMFVATFIKQAGDPYLERELSLLFGAVAVCFLIGGSGRIGLDGFLAARRAARRDGMSGRAGEDGGGRQVR
jgi:putative oxidoreductase